MQNTIKKGEQLPGVARRKQDTLGRGMYDRKRGGGVWGYGEMNEQREILWTM